MFLKVLYNLPARTANKAFTLPLRMVLCSSLNFFHPPARHFVTRAITKHQPVVGVVLSYFDSAAIFKQRLGLAGEDEEEEELLEEELELLPDVIKVMTSEEM